MQISFNTYSTQPQNIKTQLRREYKQQPIISDTYIKSRQNVNFTGFHPIDFAIRTFRFNPIHHFYRFSKDEYSRLTLSEIDKLRTQYQKINMREFPFYYNEVEYAHNEAARYIQSVFDTTFGNGNYVVVPIGRSISSICKVLGYHIGEENVKMMPLSDSRRFLTDPTKPEHYKSLLCEVKKNEGLKTFLNYLKSIGLSKKDIETSGKNYILMDYCFSGTSLRGAEELFKSDLIWGNRHNNIYAVDFLKVINAIDEESLGKNKTAVYKFGRPMFLHDILNNRLCGSNYKSLSFVRKSTRLDETSTAADQTKIGLWKTNKEKLILFKLLDDAMENAYGNMPLYKLKAIQDKDIIPGQIILPWHDPLTQTISDLRENLYNLNKCLAKTTSSTDPELKKDIEKLHQELSNLYMAFKKPDMSITEYYIQKPRIDARINDFMTKLYS